MSHVSPSDPESRLQKTQDGKRAGYNCQAAVDSQDGIILGESVSASQNDVGQFLGMADSVVETTGKTPDEFSADAGYHSAKTLLALESRDDINAYISPPRRRSGSEDRIGYEDMEYNPAQDEYYCPEGNTLAFVGEVERRDTVYRSYRSVGSVCGQCRLRGQCLEGKSRRRKILVSAHRAALQRMRDKTQSPDGRRAHQLRKSTVEHVFGTLKQALGMRQFLTRGLAGVKSEFRLAVIALNLSIIARHRMATASSSG